MWGFPRGFPNVIKLLSILNCQKGYYSGLLVITAALEADILTNKKAQTTKTIPGRCLRRSEIIKLTVFCITADVAEFFSIIHIVIIVDEKY